MSGAAADRSRPAGHRALASPPSAGARVRARARIEGTVQGVGFRPFVHRLAAELALAGWVRNDQRGVEVEIEGAGPAVEAFLARLPADAPPLARVERVRCERRPATGAASFLILASERSGAPDALVAPDAATCGLCLAELFDRGDRRFRYPFINCTDCGPRFTIVRGVPYDRARTTMAGFAMCAACRAEYEDPCSRRFHAQPNACPECGPQARLLGATGAGADAPARAARLLAEGALLAVKGLGGYHLACRADDEAAVGRLRARKRREQRPFALMVADLPAARALAQIGAAEAELLTAPARPIVLAVRRAGARIAAGVAPGLRELGVMLPYTPLHHLLLADAAALGAGALVMTSGNLCDEPIAYRADDARARLGRIADAILAHDRPIHARTEDSVMRAVSVAGRRRPLALRRARGQAPASLPLPLPAPRPLLACGAELKSTFCLARGGRAWVGPHVGDLRSWEALRGFREGVAHFEELFAVRPELVAHDLHPDYLSTAYACAREELRPLGVQHHHAHLAAVLAEHGEQGPAVGAIYDGAGYGSDGTVWGGELLVGDLLGFERAAHLRAVRLPGGDRAAQEPWRMACAWALEAGAGGPPPLPRRLARQVDAGRWAAIAEIARRGVAAPLTSSVGRLCDAIAALCGLRAAVTYEGQAAIELEAIADRHERGAYELPYARGELDARATVAAAIADLEAGASPATVSARFHAALARGTARACGALARAAGVELVVLAGGVFQNRLLLETVAERLQAQGLRVLTPVRLPPNDGAISFGQAAIASARAAHERI